MPISVTCTCGKTLKVRDELIGKRVKCPACGNAFPVTAVANAPAGGATVFNPTAAAAVKGKRETVATRGVSISWGPVLGIAALLLVGIGITAFIMGPKKVWNQWEEIGDQAQYDVIDVVTRGLQAKASKEGMYNPRKGSGPQAQEVMFFRPTMVMSMPDEVHFKGQSSLGPFEGDYNPHKREVECELAIGGGIGIPGSGGKKSKGETIKITGRRLKDPKTGADVLKAEVDGRDAVIVMPPPSDDE